MNLNFFTIIILFFALLSISLVYGEDNINNNNSLQQNSNNTATNNKIPDYKFEPFLLLDGEDFEDIAHNNTLSFENFAIYTWIKTDQTNLIDPAHIVNKGGFNTDEKGENMNYGIWFSTDGTISGGFETESGENFEANSTARYNDGNWHFILLSYNGTLLRLDVDGKQVSTKLTNGAIPDITGEQPLRIGANSLDESKFFTGNVDEVRVWNRGLTDKEISEIYLNNTFDLNGLVVYLNFGGYSIPTTNNNPSPLISSSSTINSSSIINSSSSLPDSTGKINATDSHSLQDNKIMTTTNSNSQSSNFKTATQYEFLKKWGSKGTGDGQFQRVHDLDFDPTEKYLYTVDRDGNRVQVFDKDGNFIKKWGSKGTGNGEFTVPYSVDVDSKGDVWVADRGNHRIQKFDKDGNFIFKFGSFGSQPGQFNNPRQVAVDKDIKYLYVVDSKNNRIQKFDTKGNFIKSWGTLGSGDGQFSLPVTVIIDSKGDIIVNDRGTNRVQKFDTEGNFLLKFGSTGMGNSQFSEVEHMATDKYDNIYVNDPQLGDNGSGQPSVKKFDTNGNFITKFGSLGEGNGQFTDPEHLAIDSDGNVYVSDRKANTITVFKPVA